MPKKKRDNLVSLFDQYSPIKIKYKDIFDFGELYQALHDWLLEDRGWGDEEGDLDHWTSYYSEKIDKSGGKEINVRWRLKKEPKDTDGFVYFLSINFQLMGLKSTEIIKNGQKIKAQKGECEITIVPYLQEAYKSEYTKKGLRKWMGGVLSGGVYRKIAEQRKKELYQEVYQLQNFIKQWFKLKRYLPYEESKQFTHSYAWPSHLREE